MFEIRHAGPGRIELVGRLDATHEAVVEAFLNRLEQSATVDFARLTYIASNGLGLLFAAQKRLNGKGEELTLVNLNPHIREVFGLAGFDTIFTIDPDV